MTITPESVINILASHANPMGPAGVANHFQGWPIKECAEMLLQLTEDNVVEFAGGGKYQLRKSSYDNNESQRRRTKGVILETQRASERYTKAMMPEGGSRKSPKVLQPNWPRPRNV